jgi:hypothetical protein
VKAKIVCKQPLIGQRGINQIERIVLDVGSRWVRSRIAAARLVVRRSYSAPEPCDPTG